MFLLITKSECAVPSYIYSTPNTYSWPVCPNSIVSGGGSSKEKKTSMWGMNLRIGSCLACVYRVMDAHVKFVEHERSVRVAQGDSREQL